MYFFAEISVCSFKDENQRSKKKVLLLWKQLTVKLSKVWTIIFNSTAPNKDDLRWFSFNFSPVHVNETLINHSLIILNRKSSTVVWCNFQLHSAEGCCDLPMRMTDRCSQMKITAVRCRYVPVSWLTHSLEIWGTVSDQVLLCKQKSGSRFVFFSKSDLQFNDTLQLQDCQQASFVIQHPPTSPRRHGG